MRFHELSHDLVLTLELGLEELDLLEVGVLDGLAFAAVFEGDVAVLEELPLPLVEESRVDLELITDTGTWPSRSELAIAERRGTLL